MAHAQKQDFVFWRNRWVHLNRQGHQFSRLLAAEVCVWTVVMLDTPCSEVVWLPTPFTSFPFTSPPMHHCVPSHFNWTSFSTTCGHLKEFFFLSSTALKSRIMLLSSTNTTPNSLVPFFLITVEEHVSFRILTLFPVVLLCSCNWEGSFQLLDPLVCQKSNPFPYSQTVGPI